MTTTDFAVFANDTFWGVWAAADAEAAAQMAADEHGTDGNTDGLYALPAGESILAAQRDAKGNDADLRDTVREFFGCTDAKIDAEGRVSIDGRALDRDELQDLIAHIVR